MVDQVGRKLRSLEEEDRGKEVIPNKAMSDIVPEKLTTEHHVLDNYYMLALTTHGSATAFTNTTVLCEYTCSEELHEVPCLRYMMHLYF